VANNKIIPETTVCTGLGVCDNTLLLRTIWMAVWMDECKYAKATWHGPVRICKVTRSQRRWRRWMGGCVSWCQHFLNFLGISWPVPPDIDCWQTKHDVDNEWINKVQYNTRASIHPSDHAMPSHVIMPVPKQW
jgi:hypothetical protein